MKKILAILLALSMVFALGACANKPAAEKTDAEYITEKGEMIIGITLFAPMNYYDAKNELIGFETEFAKAVCEKLGVTAKFQEISWAAKVNEYMCGDLNTEAQRIVDINKMQKSFIFEAVKEFEQASNIHFGIEEIYVNAMDFSKKEEFTAKFLSKFKI